MKTKFQNPATILVIDSDPLMLTAVAASLHLIGYECHCARDSEAALKAARGLELDLVICDTDLDDEDGMLFCRELKQQPGMSDVPVILVSAHPMSDVVQRSRDAGAVYYLNKPFDPDVLLELVDKALWMPHLVNTQIRRVGGRFRVPLSSANKTGRK